jgi:RNA polymerase sigma factor (sigma-70 family)
MTQNELIESYQNDKNIIIRDQLYEQNRELLKKLTNYLIHSLFPNICLENEDFIAYSYLAFVKCLETFNTKQTKYTFTHALITINKSMVIRYASQMLKMGQRVLNSAISICPETEFLLGHSSETEVNKKVEIELAEEKLNEFIKRLTLSNQRIVKMRMSGYSINEIAKVLHLKRKKVANKFAAICIQYRKHCI